MMPQINKGDVIKEGGEEAKVADESKAPPATDKVEVGEEVNKSLKFMNFIYKFFKYIYIAIFFYVTPWIVICVPYIMEKIVKIALATESDKKTANTLKEGGFDD